ncbi:MAG: hypothetical protein JW395_0369 [Nitrospira sp.]|nr:hypothetical protein [Nitrospira sp.]
MSPPRATVASRLREVSILTWLVIVAYIVVRVSQWVLSLPTIDGPDSHSYLPGTGLGVPPNGYFGFEKVSFTGDGIIRPWTITLPYALLLTDYFRCFFQLLVSMASWLLLAFAMVRLARGAVLGQILAVVVLVFSCTTLVTSWDLLINRESLAISLTVTLIALALLSIVYRSYGFLLLVILNCLLLLVTRPTLAPLEVLLLLVLMVDRAWRSIAARASIREVGGATILRGAFAALLAVLVVVYPAIYSMRMDASWTAWYDQTMSETQFGYVVADYNPRAEAIKAELAKTAPQCLIDELPVYTGAYVGAPWGFAAHIRNTCPEFATWYQANWPSWYYRYIAQHPDYVAKVSASGMKLALRPWDATTSFSALPVPVRDAFFPVTTGDGIAIYDPMVLYWSLVLSVILLALARWRRRGWAYVRAHWVAAALIGSVAIGSALSIIVNLLLIPSYPLETNRVNVSTALAIRLTGVLLALFLLGRLVALVRREKAPPTDHD